MAFLPFVCVLAAGAVARADDLTSVDLREEVVSLRKQNAALTHRLAALEAATATTNTTRRILPAASTATRAGSVITTAGMTTATNTTFKAQAATSTAMTVLASLEPKREAHACSVLPPGPQTRRDPNTIGRAIRCRPQCPHPREPREIPP